MTEYSSIDHTTSPVQADDPSGTSDQFVPLQTSDTSMSDLPQNELSPLEILPVEIHGMIFLELPTLQDLRSLVRASPRLHASYVHSRSVLLGRFLNLFLGHVWFDAHYCHISRAAEFQKKRTSTLIWDSFSEYQQRLASPSTLFIQQQPLEDVVAMVRFHAEVIEPIAQKYAAWALAAIHPTRDATHPSMTPSTTEMLRIYRGLYRLQIYCNLCGYVPRRSYSTRGLGSPLDSTVLLSHFPAWQVEEILCVQDFVKEKYDRVFHKVAWDLDEVNNPECSHIRLFRGLYEGLDLSHKRKRESRVLYLMIFVEARF